MRIHNLKPLSLMALLALCPLQAYAEDACTAPGVLVLEDATGDAGIEPDPAVGRQGSQPFFDIQTLHMAEPASMAGKLVFTYKIADLSTLPPQTGYILRFSSDIAPDNGDEDFFVAMVTDPSGGASFVYGSDGFEFGLPAGEPRQFHVAGDLDGASNFNADGTITLVLDKAAVPGIVPGASSIDAIIGEDGNEVALDLGAFKDPALCRGIDRRGPDQENCKKYRLQTSLMPPKPICSLTLG